MTAVNIRNPLPWIFTIIQVQHGSHSIHTDSIRVVLVRPEQCIGNQEVGYSRTAIIINQSAPMRMSPLSRVLMFIYACPVKISQSKAVPRKMCRNPVENHADALPMHIIHKIHKIIRCSIPAGRRVIPGHLIAPGCVQRMLHNRKQLDMGVTHHLHILRQFYRYLAVIIEFRTDDIIPVFITLRLFPNP